MVKLMCALVGAVGSALEFCVQVNADDSIAELKDAIQQKNTNTITCDARKLQLYLAKKGDAWLTSEDADAVKLDDYGKPPGFEAMKPSLWINNAQYFGTNFERKEGDIHVLVVVPSDEDEEAKRRRIAGAFTGVMGTPAPTETIASVPRPVIRDEKYMTVSAALLDKCGLLAPEADEVMLYCRRQVYDLWGFIEREVIADNATAFIVGPPGSGKSLATLCLVAQLDPREWNVVWIHFGDLCITCLSMGSREYWKHIEKTTFVVPRVAGKKLFVCLDGYTADPDQLRFLCRIRNGLTKDERIVVCSSMATRGKVNLMDAIREKNRTFHMDSWTLDDYEAAVADASFYEQVKSKLDARTDADQVNHGGPDEEATEEDKKTNALDQKFYYAGGSCRFMFQFATAAVQQMRGRHGHSS